jgi:dimethylargininase
MSLFRNAIVRPPPSSFAQGLSTSGLGAPILERALEQHARYCEALERCGLSLTRLSPDPRYPDGTFVEDDAILTPRGAVLARPGAESRRGEVPGMREVLSRFYPEVKAIESPGTLDGGDICEAGGKFFIGISQRTNEEGARQLSGFLEKEGYDCTFVDVRGTPGILHLKSGVAWLGEGRLVLIEALAGREEFREYESVRVGERESYAANCVRINDHVLLAAGHPVLEKALSRLGCRVVALEMSEYRKMDGGLSCLSLRF